MNHIVLWYSSTFQLPLVVGPSSKPQSLQFSSKSGKRTSQIQTSKTAAATSYAVSPQSFRTKGSADCFDKRYNTTGRCPFDAAFTVNRRSIIILEHRIRLPYLEGSNRLCYVYQHHENLQLRSPLRLSRIAI